MCKREPVVSSYRRKEKRMEAEDIEDETTIEEVEEYQSPYVNQGSPAGRRWAKRIQEDEPEEVPVASR